MNLGYHFNGADKHEYLLGPQNWLNRIAQARYFITNSFHGTVFSILYKKDFFVVPNQKEIGLNARFIELLESLELDDRLIYSREDLDDKINKKSDFKNAYRLLGARKEHSLDYIKKAIEHD
ncbi:MAG: polysaccharide pyruvyl transferase family protein [Campylobacterales bacterium]|nr:polysaccharide pyruvyl transferase family protein [Campylobacterales bacterium]